jgi:hypothetical protein
MLSGDGQLWFDNIKFEIVDSSVSTTASPREAVTKKAYSKEEPSNLDFEK